MDATLVDQTIGSRSFLASGLNFPVRNGSDFCDAAGSLCSGVYMLSGDPRVAKLEGGFFSASAALGFAGIFRDAAIWIGSWKAMFGASSNEDRLSAAKGIVVGGALAAYDISKMATFASNVGAISERSWISLVKGWGLTVAAAIGLYDDIGTLRASTEDRNKIRKEFYETRWWATAFNVGANLSTLIFSISLIAGAVLNPVLGIVLATTYIVSAVATYIFTKDMEQIAMRSVIEKHTKRTED